MIRFTASDGDWPLSICQCDRDSVHFDLVEMMEDERSAHRGMLLLPAEPPPRDPR